MKLCIAVLTTATRAETLNECLNTLGSINKHNIGKITVLVIQNRKELSDEVTSAVNNFPKNDDIEFNTVVETRLGIPMARNKGLIYAIENKFTHLGFIDDDAKPDENWLINMVKILKETNVEVVTGPQVPIFPVNTSGFYRNAKVYKERELVNRATCTWAATNNVIFDVNFASVHGLLFSEDMKTGGSDKEFFSRYTQVGGKIVWAKDAVVKEYVELNRINFKWAIKRTYRFGGTGYRIERATKNALVSSIVCVLKGVAYIVKGLVSLIILPFKKDRSVIDGFCDISHGLSFIISIFFGGKLKKYT